MYNHFVKIRSKILIVLTHQVALPLLKIIRKPVVFPLSMYDLQHLNNGTLGNDLYRFLKERKITLLPYYAKHDMKHIVLDYETNDVGEVCLQCFMLGNKHISFPVFITVVFGFITIPEHWSVFIKAYKRGASSINTKDWEWHYLINEQTDNLKQKINYKKYE